MPPNQSPVDPAHTRAPRSLPGSGSLARPTPTAAVSPAAGDGPLSMPTPQLDVGPFAEVDVREVVSRMASATAAVIVALNDAGETYQRAHLSARAASAWLDDLRGVLDEIEPARHPDDDEGAF